MPPHHSLLLLLQFTAKKESGGSWVGEKKELVCVCLSNLTVCTVGRGSLNPGCKKERGNRLTPAKGGGIYVVHWLACLVWLVGDHHQRQFACWFGWSGHQSIRCYVLHSYLHIQCSKVAFGTIFRPFLSILLERFFCCYCASSSSSLLSDCTVQMRSSLWLQKNHKTKLCPIG